MGFWLKRILRFSLTALHSLSRRSDGDEEGDGQEGDGQEGHEEGHEGGGQEAGHEAEGHEEGCEGGDRVSSRSASTIAYGVRDNDQASGGAFRVCGSSVFAWRVDFVSGVHASFEYALKRVPWFSCGVAVLRHEALCTRLFWKAW